MGQVQAVTTNELQLGQGLNRSVAGAESAKFRLLLSLLSEDVLDQPQFHHLQRTEPEDNRMAAFQQTPKQPLQMESNSLAATGCLSDQLHRGGISDIRLLNSLQPDALTLSERHDRQLEAPVASILSPVQRAKAAGEPLPEMLENWQAADLSLLTMLDSLNAA